MALRANTSKKVKILTDNIEVDPTIDFQKLGETITSFVLGSDPKFSVGLYGDWGTGKTTLMKLVESNLKKQDSSGDDILTIWFNAWRYEREEHLATIPLLKTIAFGMSGHARYGKIATSIWNGIKIIGKDILRQLILQTILSEKGWEDIESKLTEKMKFLNQIDQETIYYDGLQTIENELSKIRKNYPDSKIVIFIDDLDRCSPKKVLEVLESIKVFLDIEGFVFILGISDRTIMRLITKEYKDSGVKGEDYIQKIIQLPIRIPVWNTKDIEQMIENKVVSKLDAPYNKFIQDNKTLVALSVIPNPRELKRFINNLIVAMEVYSDLIKSNKIKEKELVVVETIKSRWNDFYLSIMANLEFRNQIMKILNSSITMNETLKSALDKDPKKQSDFEKKLILLDVDLIDFLDSEIVSPNFTSIKDWELYRKVTETTKQSTQSSSFDVRLSDIIQNIKFEDIKIPAIQNIDWKSITETIQNIDLKPPRHPFRIPDPLEEKLEFDRKMEKERIKPIRKKSAKSSIKKTKPTKQSKVRKGRRR